jgi:hypothetical protein
LNLAELSGDKPPPCQPDALVQLFQADGIDLSELQGNLFTEPGQGKQDAVELGEHLLQRRGERLLCRVRGAEGELGGLQAIDDQLFHLLV